MQLNVIILRQFNASIDLLGRVHRDEAFCGDEDRNRASPHTACLYSWLLYFKAQFNAVPRLARHFAVEYSTLNPVWVF